MRSERGSAAVEVTLLTPLVLMVVAVLVVGVRVWYARSVTTQAAASAARAATLATSASQAKAAGHGVAVAELTGRGIECRSQSVDLDVSGFAVAPGFPAEVRARIRCTVDLSDLAGFNLPGSFAVTGDATSVLDTYRRRG